MRLTYHHGDLPRALLDLALQRIETVGAEGLSLKALATELQVSHAAVYRHFTNKQAFLFAMAVEGHVALRAAIEQGWGRSPAGSQQQLLDCAFSVIRFAQRRPRLYQLMFQGSFPATLKELTEGPTDIGFGFLLEKVRAWQKGGVLAAQDPLDQGVSIWVTTHGLAQLLVSGQLKIPQRAVRALCDSVFQRMLDGLAPPR